MTDKNKQNMRSFKIFFIAFVCMFSYVNISAQSDKIAKTLDKFESRNNSVGMDMQVFGDVTVDGEKILYELPDLDFIQARIIISNEQHLDFFNSNIEKLENVMNSETFLPQVISSTSSNKYRMYRKDYLDNKSEVIIIMQNPEKSSVFWYYGGREENIKKDKNINSPDTIVDNSIDLKQISDMFALFDNLASSDILEYHAFGDNDYKTNPNSEKFFEDCFKNFNYDEFTENLFSESPWILFLDSVKFQFFSDSISNLIGENLKSFEDFNYDEFTENFFSEFPKFPKFDSDQFQYFNDSINNLIKEHVESFNNMFFYNRKKDSEVE